MQKLNRIPAIGREMVRTLGLLAFITVCLMSAQAQETPATAQAAPAQTPTADNQSADPAAPAAPASDPFVGPAITGPLQGLPPFRFDAGPLGRIAVNGILNGMGMWQSNHVPGDNSTQAALSNGQVFIRKDDGWLQFYLQAGAYNFPALSTPFLQTDKTVTKFFGPVPVAFLKLAPQKGAWKNTSILIGQMRTLIGAETGFTFVNMNIERGLLWNQGNAITRGIQLNQTLGKFSASVSWNDGFYSNRYTWMTGSIAYTNGPHSITFIGGGNLGQTAYLTAATPMQNNSQIYNIIYKFTKGPWIIQPYWQYTNVPTNLKIGITKGASTNGGAVLLSYAFKHGFSLAGRGEYITSTGHVADNAVNLLFGPGSNGWSATLTPTFQYGGLFFRGDLSWVQARSYIPGSVFGPTGMNQNQARAMAEIGFIFGKNITER
jgi:hypothetical protein